MEGNVIREKNGFVMDSMNSFQTFIKKTLVRQCLAEMAGTLVFILCGCGAVAQSVLSENKEGNSMTVALGFSAGLAIAVYVAGGISGGHMNPAVSLAMACVGKLKWNKFPFYVIAQFIGAFFGAVIVYTRFYEKIMAFNSNQLSVTGMNGTGHIFASYPAADVSTLEGLKDQVMGTAMLVAFILAITDRKNIGAPRGVEALSVAVGFLCITCSGGLYCGYPLNPARDLGPRIFTAMAGWGTAVFSAGNNWWWIPVVGPMIGGPIGAFFYTLFIKWPYHLKVEEEEGAEGEEGDNNLTQVVAESMPGNTAVLDVNLLPYGNTLPYRGQRRFY